MSSVRALGRQVLAWMVASVSVWFAWRYGMALGGPEGAMLFAVLDVYKCKMPMYAIGAVSRGRTILGIAGGVGFVWLCLLNIWGTMSVEVLARAALTAQHTSNAQQLTDLLTERRRAENRLGELGKRRPVAEVEADIKAERHNWRWTRSKGCTDAARDSRAFCAAYDRLFGELAGAQDAANLHARVDELQGEIARTRAAQTPNASELQLVAKLTGIGVETAGLIRALVFAAVVEIVCSLAPTLVWVNRPGSRPRRRRHGTRRSWRAWCKAKALRARARLRSTPTAVARQPLDCGREKEVSPFLAPPETGSALRAEGGEAFAATDDGTPGRDEAGVPDCDSAVRMTRGAPKGSLEVVRSRNLGSGPGGDVLAVVQGGAAVASKVPAESLATEITRFPTAEVHAPAARKIPTGSRSRTISGARARGRMVSSLREGGRGKASRSPASPRPVTTGKCSCSNIADFLRQRLERVKGASISAAELLSTYNGWCLAHGHKPVSQHRLGAALTDLGFEKWKSDGRIRYRDLRLRA